MLGVKCLTFTGKVGSSLMFQVVISESSVFPNLLIPKNV